MTYLLDTCVISELLKLKPNQRVMKWFENRSDDTLYLSALTLGEIQKGIAKLTDTKRRGAIQHWLDTDVRARFSDRILPVDEKVALTWGQIEGDAQRRGFPVPTVDALLGATAIVHNLVIVTRDTSDIERTGARVLNPWNF